MDIAAVIDIGSNTVQLLVGAVDSSGLVHPLDRARVVTRLGAGVAATGSLDHQAITATVAACTAMAAQAARYRCPTRIVATSATREARNGDALVAAIQAATGIAVEVIDGDSEARLAFRGATLDVTAARDTTVVVADIGGNSTELVCGRAGHVDSATSLAIGAVRATVQLFPDGIATQERVAACRRSCRDLLATTGPPWPDATLVMTGGMASTLRAMTGAQPSRPQLAIVLARIIDAATPDERAALSGMPADRADIAVAGAIIADEVITHVQPTAITLAATGLREGVLVAALDR